MNQLGLLNVIGNFSRVPVWLHLSKLRLPWNVVL
jgi:hypothetical protein